MTSPPQRLSELEAALAGAGLDPGRHRALLARVRAFFTRYAYLEKTLLGSVRVPVPRHLVEEELPPGDPLEAAEILAARERARLGLLERETGDVMDLLDRESLKVYRPPFPAASPLEGVFLFDPEVGPAFVADGALDPLEVDFVLARLYGHFLLDHDPYRIQLVVSGEGNGSAVPVRANAFASAFLVGRDRLAAYLEAAGWTGERELDHDLLEQLALYFEVGYRALLTRLLALGYVVAERLPALLQAAADARSPEVSPRETSTVPERFRRLALEAHARGRLDLDDLAAYLETDAATARALAGRFTMPKDEPDGPSPGPRA